METVVAGFKEKNNEKLEQAFQELLDLDVADQKEASLTALENHEFLKGICSWIHDSEDLESENDIVIKFLFDWYMIQDETCEKMVLHTIPIVVWQYLWSISNLKVIPVGIESLLIAMYTKEKKRMDREDDDSMELTIPSLERASVYHQPKSGRTQTLTSSALAQYNKSKKDVSIKRVTMLETINTSNLSHKDRMVVVSTVLRVFSFKIDEMSTASKTLFCQFVTRILHLGYSWTQAELDDFAVIDTQSQMSILSVRSRNNEGDEESKDSQVEYVEMFAPFFDIPLTLENGNELDDGPSFTDVWFGPSIAQLQEEMEEQDKEEEEEQKQDINEDIDDDNSSVSSSDDDDDDDDDEDGDNEDVEQGEVTKAMLLGECHPVLIGKDVAMHFVGVLTSCLAEKETRLVATEALKRLYLRSCVDGFSDVMLASISLLKSA